MGHMYSWLKANLHNKNERKKTFREHRCGAGQTLSEGQVKIRLFSSRALERVNLSYLDLRECYSFYSSRELLFLLTSRYFQCGTLIQFPLLDLRAFLGNRDFGSWALTMPVSDGPSRCVGPSLHRLYSFDPFGPLRPAHQIILSPSLAKSSFFTATLIFLLPYLKLLSIS